MNSGFRFLPVLILGIITLVGVSHVAAIANSSRFELALDLSSGIVVEKILPHSSAEKAGLLVGDVLLRWERVNDGELFESPYDFILAEIDQGPRGPVTMIGRRGDQERSWVMGPGEWGAQTRPSFNPLVQPRYERGKQLALEGKTQQAAQAWQKLAVDTQEADPSWLRSWLLFRTAEMFIEAQEWEKADPAYQESTRWTRNRKSYKALLLKIRADRLLRRQDWQHAKRYFEESLGESKTMPSEVLLAASALHGLGIVAYMESDFQNSEKFYRDSLEIRRKAAPCSLVVAASLNNLAALEIDRGELTIARDYQKQASSMWEQLVPWSLDTAKSLHNLGKISFLRGDLSEAEEYDRKALEIKESLVPQSADVSIELNSLGAVAKERGELALAEKLYQQALAIQEKLVPNSPEAAATLNNLGEVAWARNDLELAGGYFRRGMKILQQIGSQSIEFAGLLTNLAAIAGEQGDLEQAAELHRRALAVEERLAPGSLEMAQSFSNLGDIVQRRGDLESAEKYQLRAIEIQEKQAPESLAIANTLNALGDLFLDRGNLDQAENYYRRSLSLREKLAPGSIFHAETLAALGGVQKRKHALDSAAQFYEQALNALESQTAKWGGSESARSGFRARHSDYYRAYIEILLTQGRTEFAFDVLERSRARSLLETLTEARLDIRNGVDTSLLERERTLQRSIQLKADHRLRLLAGGNGKEELPTVEHEIDELLKDYEEVQGRIRSESPAYASLTQPRPLLAKEIQKELLDSNTVLLEYSLGEESSSLFEVTSTSLMVFQLPKRAEIEGKALIVYDLLTAPNRILKKETEWQRDIRLAKARTQYASAAAELSDMVLGPVMAQSRGKRLLIVSDGALQYIPFAALPVVEDPGAIAGMSSRVPLVVKHEIVNLPSASVLKVIRQTVRETSGQDMDVAVIADPVFDAKDVRLSGRLHGAQEGRTAAREFTASPSASRLTRSLAEVNGELRLTRLPFSRLEAEAVMSVVPAGKGLKALDFQASRTTATSPELRNYKIIHFATHGLLNNEHPELSGLVFSLINKDGEQQNGFLDLQDIYNMNLTADLVFLSACETGLGKELDGEGLIGLTRGFMHAGAKRVVASLWGVSDVATARLVEEFYRAMKVDGMSPASALRTAQIRLWQQKRWNSPYYWAAFQLHGDWK